MNLDVPILIRLAPSMKRAAGISAAAIVTGLLILFFGALPKQKAIRSASDELQAINAQLTQMRSDIASTEQQKSATGKVQAERDALAVLGVIEPLLGSFAMRGKSLLDPLAQQTGFRIDSVRELPPITLQLPKPAPEQLHCRQPVEFTGQGSYVQIVAFIAQVEASQPLAALSGLLILGQPQSPETHKAIITFEWPAKCERSKSETAPKK